MQKDLFDVVAMNRKLCSIVNSTCGRRKSKAQESARSSRPKHNESVKQRSISKDHTTLQPCHPLSNDFFTTRSKARKTVRVSAQTERETASHTIAQLDSKITEVGQELQSALTSNQVMNAQLAKLRVEKSECQVEVARLQEQLRVLTKSHASMVELNDSLASRLNQTQSDLQSEIAKCTDKDQALLKMDEAKSQKQKSYESQLLDMKKQWEQQRVVYERELSQSNNQRLVLEKNLADAVKKIQELEQEQAKFASKVKSLEANISNAAHDRAQLAAKQKELQARRSELEQRCRQLEQRCRELEQRLSASQGANCELQNQLIKHREQEVERELLTDRKENELRDRIQSELERLKFDHKEQIRRLEQSHHVKLKQMQELASSNLLVKEKEISLVRVSSASELERLRGQIAQLTLARGQRDSQLKTLQKKLAEVNSQLSAKVESIESLEEKNMELRLQVEELEYTVGKLSKIASDAKTTAGKEASNRQEATLHIKEKDRQIEQLERENSELSGECDELVQKMECFCEKVQELEAHMHSEASIKEGLENRLRELELRLSGGLKDPLLEQQLSSLSSQNEQLRRTVKEHKLRQKLSEDKVREMQVQLDEACERYNNQQAEVDKLAQESQKARFLSQQVESANRISEINLKSLLKNLQQKQQLSLSLKDQLVKEQFRNDLLVTELKALKENHRNSCNTDRCPKNNTPALDDILRQRPNNSRRSDLAMRTIDTNAGTEDHRADKMTI